MSLRCILKLLLLSIPFSCATSTNPLSEFDFQVEEGVREGHVVGTLDAARLGFLTFDSKDEQVSTSISFHTFALPEIQRVFSVHPRDGAIRAAGVVDREKLCRQQQNVQGSDDCTITFRVQVTGFRRTEGGDTKSLSTVLVKVNIHVTDVNDFLPTFEHPTFQLYIAENSPVGSKFLLPLAKDPDSERFSVISYSIKSPSKQLSNYFRFIQTKDFSSTVGASASSSSPSFQPSRTAGVPVPQLVQIDALDRETLDYFQFTLVATDGGGKTGEMAVSVTIQDRNDNSPQWRGLPYERTLSECTKPTKEIFTLVADDADEGVNARLRYEISSLANDFVKRNFFISGNQLMLSGVLDYLQHQQIAVPVTVLDGGDLSNSTRVLLRIQDCNNHDPVIRILSPLSPPSNSEGANKLSLMENDQEERVIAMIQVSDLDSGAAGSVHCTLLDATGFRLHEISDPQSDRVRIFNVIKSSGVSFDREAQPSGVNFLVQCEDMSGAQGPASLRDEMPRTVEKAVHISLLDDNDNSPVLAKNMEFFVTENNLINCVIGHLQATDPDLGLNKQLQFSLINETSISGTSGASAISRGFDVTTAGEVLSNHVFDREQQSVFILHVKVCDSGTIRVLCSEGTVTVKILDQNDNAPIYHSPLEFYIEESQDRFPVTHVLGQLNATDADAGRNGTVRFYWSHSRPQDKDFSTSVLPPEMHRGYHLTETGLLSVNGVLDREQSPVHHLSITVTDLGDPTMHAITLQLVVHLTDVNDNVPKLRYPQPGDALNTSQDLTVGSTLAVLQADDPDEGRNGTVKFSLQSSYASQFFLLQETGELILNRSLELLGQAQKKSILTLYVNMSDCGLVKRLWNIVKIRLEVHRSPPQLPHYGGSGVNQQLLQPNDGKGRFEDSFLFRNKGLLVLICLSVAVILVFSVVLSIFLYLYGKNGCCKKNQEARVDFSISHPSGFITLDRRDDQNNEQQKMLGNEVDPLNTYQVALHSFERPNCPPYTSSILLYGSKSPYSQGFVPGYGGIPQQQTFYGAHPSEYLQVSTFANPVEVSQQSLTRRTASSMALSGEGGLVPRNPENKISRLHSSQDVYKTLELDFKPVPPVQVIPVTKPLTSKTPTETFPNDDTSTPNSRRLDPQQASESRGGLTSSFV